MVAPGRKDYQRTRDGKYRAQPRDPLTGKRLSIVADTLPELHARLKKLADVRRDLRYQQITPQEARRILRPVEGKLLTVRDIWDRYIKGVPAASKATARSQWENRLEPWFGDKFAWELDQTKMREWYQELTDGPKKAATTTAENAFWYLYGAFKLAVSEKLLDGLPWGEYKAPKGTRRQEPGIAKSDAELARIVTTAFEADAADWARGSYADRHTVIWVVGQTGMRQAEACGLGWDHCSIDAGEPVITIEFQAKRRWKERSLDRPRDPTKTKRTAVLRISEDAMMALRLHRERLRQRGWYRADGPVFPGKGGRWRTSARVMKPEAFRAIVQAAGIEDFKRWVFHSLRHSFATLEASASKDIRSTMDRTRHTSQKQFMGYMHRLGHGLPAPGISLPRAALPPAMVDTTGEALPPLVEVIAGANERAAEIKAEREAEREKKRTMPLEDVAWKYAELGWSAERLLREPPPEATARFKRAYSRGYAKGGRQKDAPDDARKRSGMAARRATLGAWAKIVRRVVGLRNASNGAPPPAVDLELEFQMAARHLARGDDLAPGSYVAESPDSVASDGKKQDELSPE